MMAIIIILLIIFAIWFILQLLNMSPFEKSCVYCFTGQMGAGKSYICVNKAVNSYNKATKHWKKQKFITEKIKRKQYTVDKPLLLSLLPIGTWKKDKTTKSKVFIQISSELKADHLLEKIYIPLNSTILLEEAGTVISQWSFETNENKIVGEFVRFFRQWIGDKNGLLIINDQASSEIAKNIRVRCGIIYNLRGFHRWLCLPLYKVRYQSLVVSDDTVVNQGSTDLQKNTLLSRKQLVSLPYIIGSMPYCSRKYDTHAYRKLYYDKFGKYIINDGSKVEKLIDMPKTYSKKIKV